MKLGAHDSMLQVYVYHFLEGKGFNLQEQVFLETQCIFTLDRDLNADHSGRAA
jgi:hypothetical protein